MDIERRPIHKDHEPSDITHVVRELLLAKNHFAADDCATIFEDCDRAALWQVAR
jgi:hypothetical protein